MLVHGEEHITIHGQLKCDQTYETHEEIVDFCEKGKSGSVLLMRSRIFSMQDELMATIKTSFFIRGLTGHGYQGTSGF